MTKQDLRVKVSGAIFNTLKSKNNETNQEQEPKQPS